MVFLSNLGWKISVWSSSCYCSSAWWWWWLLLWDLLERCKEVPFFFPLCDLFGGGHLDSAGGFLLEKYIILSIGLLLLSVAGNDRAGFESTLDKKYTVRFPHRELLVASFFTRSRSFPSCSRPLEQLEIAVPCGKMFDHLMFCVAHC